MSFCSPFYLPPTLGGDREEAYQTLQTGKRNPNPVQDMTDDPPGIHTIMKQFSSQLFLLILILLLAACGGVKLIDIPKSTATLELSEEQEPVIHSKISLIRDIVEDYEFERKELQGAYHRYQSDARLTRLSRYEGGGRNSEFTRNRSTLRTKIRSFVRQRNEYAKEITDLIDEIKVHITTEQLVVFEDIKLPTLELPDMLKRRPYREFEMIPGTRWGWPDDF